MNANEADEAQNLTVDLDLELALDALIAAWEGADGNSHVLAYHDDSGEIEEHYVTYEVRDHSRDGDCIHVSEVFEHAYIKDGEVVEYTVPDTLTFGGETFGVRVW